MANAQIQFGFGQFWLGGFLVAASPLGVCSIKLGDDPQALMDDLRREFPQAEPMGKNTVFKQWMAAVVGLMESPGLGLEVPLDVRGTEFQQRVWQALRAIPVGQTASYAEIARRIGQPKAVRAVAGACAANRLAVVIPCHRVVGSGYSSKGELGGYRWGVERKQALLNREKQAPLAP